ncbi:MAG TPA: hypothetical protein VGE39_01430, partial [Prosthecobacter sp.]
LFEVFRHLRLPMRRDKAPANVSQVELCAVSGQLPTPHCQHRVQGGFIPGVSPITPCDVHREVLLDSTSGLRVAREDGRPGLKREVYEFWPPDLLEMFKLAGVPRKTPPPLEPSSQSLASADAAAVPRIVSPRPALVYTLQASDASRQSIPLRADTAPGVSRVFWFAGPRFLGASDPATAVMWPAAAGKWRVHVLDDHGRSAEVEVKVEMVP